MVSREFARVFGVDFFSVLSRGSQYKVESFMFRLAKPESFVLISPSKADVRFTVILAIHINNICQYLGWQAKWRWMYAPYHGAAISFLLKSTTGAWLSIVIPIINDSLQLLLFDVPRASVRLSRKESVWRCGWLETATKPTWKAPEPHHRCVSVGWAR